MKKALKNTTAGYEIMKDETIRFASDNL